MEEQIEEAEITPNTVKFKGYNHIFFLLLILMAFQVLAPSPFKPGFATAADTELVIIYNTIYLSQATC